MNIAIIKYNAGTICSVEHALRRLGREPIITNDKETRSKADTVIFPGVGEAKTTMEYLRKEQLDVFIKSLKQPVLGICLGMQLMCRHSEEGDTECLGIFDTDVSRFIPQKHDEKIPHMGWDSIEQLKSPLFDGIEEGSYVYYVHSFAPTVNADTIAVTTYGETFSAAIRRGNFFGTQFHPEKSASVGEHILQNFLRL